MESFGMRSCGRGRTLILIISYIFINFSDYGIADKSSRVLKLSDATRYSLHQPSQLKTNGLSSQTHSSQNQAGPSQADISSFSSKTQLHNARKTTARHPASYHSQIKPRSSRQEGFERSSFTSLSVSYETMQTQSNKDTRNLAPSTFEIKASSMYTNSKEASNMGISNSATPSYSSAVTFKSWKADVVRNVTTLLPSSSVENLVVTSSHSSAESRISTTVISRSMVQSNSTESTSYTSTSIKPFATTISEISNATSASYTHKISSSTEAQMSSAMTMSIHSSGTSSKIAPSDLSSSNHTSKILKTSSVSIPTSVPTSSHVSKFLTSSESKSINTSMASIESVISTTGFISTTEERMSSFSPATATLLPTSSAVTPSSISTNAPRSLTTSFSSLKTPSPTKITPKTVTVCPWDTLAPAMIMPSMSTSAVIFSSISIKNASNIEPAKKGCDVVLQGLSNAMANISHCMIKYLHPLQVCMKCTGPYLTMEEYHKFAFKKCGNELIHEYFDKFQVIPKFYDFYRAMWNSFQCEKCYKSREKDNPIAPWIPTKDFKMIQHLLMQTITCFANHSKLHLPYEVHVDDSQSQNSSKGEMCSQCKSVYKEFRRLYGLRGDNSNHEKRWCADIVYGLNETRKVWTKNCEEKLEDKQSIIALTCFFCFIPIVFYVGTKLHSDVKERKNESRLRYESE